MPVAANLTAERYLVCAITTIFVSEHTHATATHIFRLFLLLFFFNLVFFSSTASATGGGVERV